MYTRDLFALRRGTNEDYHLQVADQLELERIGPQHQAGSDSMLTGHAFFKMREMYFEDNIDEDKYSGHLYGLGTASAVNGQAVNHDGLPSDVQSTTIGSTTTTTTSTVTSSN